MGACLLPKLDFSVFDGTNTHTWIQKAERYFHMYHIPLQQRVEIASLHMTDKAEHWYFSMIVDNEAILNQWEFFTHSLLQRFGCRIGFDLIKDFNKLKQYERVEQYVEDFEEKRYQRNICKAARRKCRMNL
ncbi:hypothetical protein Droror1_Dr00016040 [Drosera rotundifolia]